MSFFSDFLLRGFSMYLYYLLLYFGIAGALFLVFWYAKKKYFKAQRIQSSPRANKKSISHEIKYSICTLSIFTIMDIGLYLAQQQGFTKIYTNVSKYGWPYLVGNLIFMLFIHDTYFYWIHRFMHWKYIYKYVHRVHHRSVDPSPLAAFSFHPVEAILEASVYVLFAMLVPVHLITLLSFQIVMTTLNAVGHLGYEIYPKGFTKNKIWQWKTTSTHHNMHHEKFKGNYGLYFTFWDKWFKTEFKDYHQVFENITHNEKSLHQPQKNSTASIDPMV